MRRETPRPRRRNRRSGGEDRRPALWKCPSRRTSAGPGSRVDGAFSIERETGRGRPNSLDLGAATTSCALAFGALVSPGRHHRAADPHRRGLELQTAGRRIEAEHRGDLVARPHDQSAAGAARAGIIGCVRGCGDDPGDDERYRSDLSTLADQGTFSFRIRKSRRFWSGQRYRFARHVRAGRGVEYLRFCGSARRTDRGVWSSGRPG